MTIDALRERIQPALQQDFDAVREEFVAESGTEDLRALVRHLREWELIPVDLAGALLLEMAGGAEPEPEEPSEDDEATLLDLDPEDDLSGDAEQPPEVIAAAQPPAPEIPAPEIPAPEPSGDKPPESPGVAAVEGAIEERPAPDKGIEAAEKPPEAAEKPPEAAEKPPEAAEKPPEAAVSPEAPEAPEAPAETSAPEERPATKGPESVPPVSDPAATVHDEAPTTREERDPPQPEAKGEDFDPEADTVHMDRRSLATPVPAPAPADRTGRYEVLPSPPVQDRISRTYRARDTRLGREVGWRVPHVGSDTPKLRFLREVQVSVRLDLAGIPQIHEDLGEDGCIVQRAGGSSLADVLAEIRASRAAGATLPALADPWLLTARLLAAAAVVGAAHAHKIVHRDLVPENILLDKQLPVTFVAGWGYARELPGATITLPPEPSRAGAPRSEGEAPSARADVAALGQMLRDIWALSGGLPEGPIKAAVERATAADPAVRHADAQALADDLWRALAPSAVRNNPAAAATGGPLRPVALLFARHPEIVLVGGAMMLTGWAATILLAALW